jgi:hypothetical protein
MLTGCWLLDLQDITYSRKNFQRPELQRMPHRDFQQEVGGIPHTTGLNQANFSIDPGPCL